MQRPGKAGLQTRMRTMPTNPHRTNGRKAHIGKARIVAQAHAAPKPLPSPSSPPTLPCPDAGPDIQAEV